MLVGLSACWFKCTVTLLFYTFRNVGGVFVVLAGGSFFAFLVAILEFIWKVARNANKDGVHVLTLLTHASIGSFSEIRKFTQILCISDHIFLVVKGFFFTFSNRSGQS